MKILHALVGYLAATTLASHPFAFASPLRLAAIDFDSDGYVKTQNYKDSALMKRVSGDIIETRQSEVVIPLAFIVTDIVAGIILKLVLSNDDDDKRAAFTQDSVSQTIAQYPNFNWVICHTSYSIAFDGVEGTDFGHTHHELGISLSRTIGYDLYWAKSGSFNRYGDGGYINWAYTGNIVGTDNGGATIYFGEIS